MILIFLPHRQKPTLSRSWRLLHLEITSLSTSTQPASLTSCQTLISSKTSTLWLMTSEGGGEGEGGGGRREGGGEGEGCVSLTLFLSVQVQEASKGSLYSAPHLVVQGRSLV